MKYVLSLIIVLVISFNCFAQNSTQIAARNAALLAQDDCRISEMIADNQLFLVTSTQIEADDARIFCTDENDLFNGDINYSNAENWWYYGDGKFNNGQIYETYADNSFDTAEDLWNVGEFAEAQSYYDSAILDYLDAEQDFYQAFRDYSNAEVDFILAWDDYTQNQ